MAVRNDAGGIFLSDNIWSKDKPENRENPVELVENNGWGESYSQAGGDPVQRKLMNRNFYKHGSLAYDINRYGILPWHKEITYEVGAVAIGSDNKTYRAEATNTDKDPVINAGTEWKLAQFAAINGSQGNITVTKDAKNNLTINTAVNLENKANTTLDNIPIGDLLGKFQDTATVKWVSSNNKLQSTALTPNGTITTDKIADGNVTTAKIANAQVTTDKLAPNAVTTAKVLDNNITTTKVVNEAIIADKLAANAVTTVKVADGNITTPKIANGHVTTDKIAVGAINTSRLADANVTTAKIVNGGITAPKIAANAVGTANIIDSNVTSAKIANANVNIAKLAADVINRFTALENKMNQLNRANRILSGFSNAANSLNFAIVTGATGCALIRVYGSRNAAYGNYGANTLALKKDNANLRVFSAATIEYGSRNSSANPYFEYAVTGQAANTQVNGYNVTMAGAGTFLCVGYSVIPY